MGGKEKFFTEDLETKEMLDYLKKAVERSKNQDLDANYFCGVCAKPHKTHKESINCCPEEKKRLGIL